MIIHELCRHGPVRKMAGLAGDSPHVLGRERMSISRRPPVFSFVMAVLTGVHGIIEIVPDRLLKRIPFGKVMFLVSGMARDTIHSFGFVNIRLQTPVIAPFSFTVESVTGPTIFIRRPPDDLKMEFLKIF